MSLFDPRKLTIEASLNRTCLADLRGADAGWVGRPAFDLLSLAALARLARELEFGEPASGSEVVWSLSTALVANDQPLAERAARVVEVFGRRVAHLIATLTADVAVPPGSSAWRAAYLRHWAQVERIWLGGGLVAALGPRLLEVVVPEAARLGAGTRTIEVARHAAVLPLIGAARSRLHPPTRAVVVVLDFGHTAVKRGLATVRDHQLVHLEILSSRPVPAMGTAEAAVVDFVLENLADTIRVGERSYGTLDPYVMVSLASYISRNRPADPRSVYAALGTVGPGFLDEQLLRRSGMLTHVRLLHDGTAAARGLPDPGNAGLIMLGTALGAGFSPSSSTLLRMSPDLRVASEPVL